jgi:hypothetical protein
MFNTSYSSILILGIYLFSVGLVSCKKNTKSENSQNPDDDTLVFNLKYNSLQLTLDTINFGSKVPQSILINPLLEESSGILASRINPNMYWLHEDSGSESEIYLYHENGQRKQHYNINGIEAIDYEDISYGFGPQKALNYIYLGDIGDNNQSRPNIVIYRFPEPNYNLDSNLNEINNVEELTLTYPSKDDEVQNENAEAFFIDPISGDLFLFSKSTTLCKVLTVEAPLPFGKEAHLKHIGDLNFKSQKITGADISLDGQHILIKSYDYIYYWKRETHQTIIDALQSIPVRLTYTAEPQGESITWKPNSMSYVTISEFKSGILPGFRVYNP